MSVAPIPAIAAPARYRVLRLGGIAGRATSGESINDEGRVAGWAMNADGVVRAFRSQPNAAIDASSLLAFPSGIAMPSPPQETKATGIAADGTVVGFSRDAQGTFWPLLWTPDGRIVSGANGNGLFTTITPSGDALGWVYRWSNPSGKMIGAPYIRRADGTTQTLTLFEGTSSATGLSVSGHWLGTSRATDGADARTFLWRGGTEVTYLGTFGRVGVAQSAMGMNRNGRWLVEVGPTRGGVMFTGKPGQTAVELPRAGHNVSQAYDVNDLEQIVGWTGGGEPSTRPVVWHVGPTDVERIDLNTRVPGLAEPLSEARAVNNEGQIVATHLSRVPGGRVERQTVLLTPERLALTAPERPELTSRITLTVAGCEPGARVQVFFSPRPPARGTIYAAMGIRWDITGPDSFGGAAIADAAGVARIQATTPSTAATIYLQAVHRGNKSAVVALTPVPVLPRTSVPITPVGPKLPIPKISL